MGISTISLLADLADWFSNPLAVLGVVLAALGLACVFIAKRLTKAIRHTKTLETSDKLYVGICLFGLVLVLVALILVAVASSKLPQ